MNGNNIDLRKKIEIILRQNLFNLEKSSAFVTDIADEIILFINEHYNLKKRILKNT